MLDLLRQLLQGDDSSSSGEIPPSVPETLARHSLTGVYLIQDETFRYVNEGLAEMLGYELDELVDRLGPKEVTHPEDWPGVEENLRRRLHGEVETVRYGFRVVTKDESVRHVEVEGSRVEHGGRAAVAGVLIDVTERERSFTRLEESRNLLRRSQRVAKIGGWEYDPETDTARGTEELYHILGLPLGEGFTLETGLDFYAPEARALIAEAIETCIKEGTPFDHEVRLATDGEEEIWVRVRGRAEFQGDELKRLIGTLQDVTERRETEQALRTTKEEAEEASNMKSALLANMSHEFRTPLSSIIGFAELMEERTDDTIRNWAQSIRSSGQRLHETLDEVLRLAQLEGGEFALEFEPVVVPDLVGETLRLMEAEAQRKDLSLDIAIRDLEDPVVLSPLVLETALTRLVHNAVKFTQEGDIDVRIERRGELVVVRVEDTGVGISDEARERIYEPFYQASRGLSRKYEGAGLGLTIVQRLVDRAGGTVEVESQEGRGTVVTVSLPLEQTDEGSLREDTPPEREARRDHDEPPRLLVVEDDEGMRALVREMLAPEIEVREAGDPDTAKTRAEEETFDAVLLDINLRSSLSGTELVDPIRERQNGGRSPKMIAMTAYALPGDRERFLEEGFDDYISKPFTREVLREKVGA